MGKNKNIQLDLSKRRIIADQLNKGSTATEIAELIGVNKTTISREVKKYRYLFFKEDKNASICGRCFNNASCTLHHRCGMQLCSLKCVGCKTLEVCSHFKEMKCLVEFRFPFVCNGCKHASICKRNHYSYDPDKANEMASKIRIESRKGLNLTVEEFDKINKTVSEGVHNGQSLYHISHSENLGKSLKTLYNYVNSGVLTAKRMDLPRAVTLKKRKTKISSKYEYNENKNIDRKHRMYSDWLIYQAKNRIIVYWQMDFLGAPKKSEQEILTLVIPQFEFVYLIPMKDTTKDLVKATFDMLEGLLDDDFEKVFEAILTDRDCKFNSFLNIEINDNGEARTRVFFCNPAASNEKPSVENFNQQIRAVFKKGVNLSNITFEQCNVISSHLNSRFLNSIDGKRPCDLFIEYFGQEIFNKLGLKEINPKEVKVVSYKKY